MSTIVTTLTWSLHQGTRLVRTIRWLTGESVVRTPTAIACTVRSRPAGTILLTLGIGTGITVTEGIATLTITEAQSALLPVGTLPFDIVPTIDSVEDTTDALQGVLTVTRAMGDLT